MNGQIQMEAVVDNGTKGTQYIRYYVYAASIVNLHLLLLSC